MVWFMNTFAKLNFHPKTVKLLSLICLLIIVKSAYAEDVMRLDSVEVVGNYDNGLGSSDAASQGVVTRNLIESRPALRTGELLEFVPNLIVSQHSGNGKANQYYLRGFNLDHGTDFATFVDGVPVNMRTHAHGQGYTDLNFLIPELVNRIDYKKGPYFAEEGDFASAGSAHMQLLNRMPSGLASVTFGTYGYQRYLLANSTAIADGDLLYALEVNRNNGPWESKKI
jgi:outer membrane cobalamin receptor